jgi:hypothetical protein
MLTPIIYKKKTKMKKVLLTVITFALITSSCNKYKDDFKNLNAKIDALATQVAGVSALQTSITALQTQLTSLSTAVAAIPNNTAAIATLTANLATLTTTVNNVQTALNTLATNVAAGNVTTQGLINQLITTTAANQTATANAIAALSTQIATVKTQLDASIAASNTAQTTALTTLLTNLSSQLTAAQAANTAAIAAAQAALTMDNASQTAILQALIQSLQTQLAIANANIQTLLASNDFFVGNLIINDETTLVAAENLGTKVKVITGNLTINTSALSAAQMLRLKQVTNGTQASPATAFIGSVVGNVSLAGSNVIDLGKLVSVSGDGVTTGDLSVTGAAHILSALLNVKKDYTLSANAVDDAVLSVGGNLSLNYSGAYSYPALTSVGGTLTATDFGASPWTTSVSFPALTSTNVMNSGSGNGNLSYTKATSINIGSSASVFALNAPLATTVTLGEDAYAAGLAITAPVATTVDLSKLVTAVGPVSVSTAAAGTVSFTNFTGNGANPVTVTGPTTLNMPVYTGIAGQSLNSTTVKTATLAAYQAAPSFAGLTILENLTLGNAANSITGLATTLKTIDATGKALASASLVLGPTYVNLTTIKVAGEMTPVTIQGSATDVISSVTTSGVINEFNLFNTKILTSVSLGHTHKVGGPGSILNVQGNQALTSLTSSTDFASAIIINNNTALTSINLASYVTPILGGNVTIWVANNRTTGTYTPAVQGTATTAYVGTKITSASLSTIKAYVALLNGASTPATVSFNLGIYDVDPTAGVQSVDAALSADTWLINPSIGWAGSPANVVGTHIDTNLEFSLLQ